MINIRFDRRHCVSVLLAPVLLLLPSYTAGAQGAPATCPMIAGGGGMLVHDLRIAYAASSDETGSTLRGMAIVRAARGAGSEPPAGVLERFKTLQMRHSGSGGSAGPLMIVHEASTNTVWINDSIPVSFTGNNNVLLVDVDASGTITTAGQGWIEPRFLLPTAPCDEASVLVRYQEIVDTLWARFQASPEIRAFVSP